MRSACILMSILFPGLGHIVKGEHAKGVVLSICYGLSLQGFLYSTYVWRLMFAPAFPAVCLVLAVALWAFALVDISRRLYFVDEDAEARNRDRLFREGLLAYLRGDLPRSEEALVNLLKVDRDDADGCFHLALVYRQKGDVEKARKTLRRCRSADDNDKWEWEIERESLSLGIS